MNLIITLKLYAYYISISSQLILAYIVVTSVKQLIKKYYSNYMHFAVAISVWQLMKKYLNYMDIVAAISVWQCIMSVS